MCQWELDGPAAQEFGDLPARARKALAEFMDAVVLVDPFEYQRRPDEPASPRRNLRSLHFGLHDEGLVTLLVYEPDDLVLVVKIQWIGD
jgi:hypothetical protein